MFTHESDNSFLKKAHKGIKKSYSTNFFRCVTGTGLVRALLYFSSETMDNVIFYEMFKKNVATGKI